MLMTICFGYLNFSRSAVLTVRLPGVGIETMAYTDEFFFFFL